MAEGKRKRQKKWNKKEVLARLMRIAEEAREATFSEKTGKNGEPVIEYDAKCATIELKAIEYAVRLCGLLDGEEDRRICVSIGEEAKDYAQ